MRHWLRHNGVLVITLASVLLYAGFVEWAFGWRNILEGWQDLGLAPTLIAVAALVGTQAIRTHRIGDYFGTATAGSFFALYRVTQIHNLLNIMLPFRTGETSFPVLMRAEFEVPLARGTAALLVLRLMDLHALLAAAGLALVADYAFAPLAILLWLAFALLPIALFPFGQALLAWLEERLSGRLKHFAGEARTGLPAHFPAFFRAWALTIANWLIKIVVMAWALLLMGVTPLAATFGGAVGGELSSVLPFHAPAGVGTYPAGIAAGAAIFGAARSGSAFETLATAGINLHLLVIVSALVATALSLLVPKSRTRPSEPAQSAGD